jgi:biotin/methionine sulfoxide reductase
MISVSWSLTRQDHGEQPFWAAIMLASMLGQIGLPGGGFGFGYSAMNYVGSQHTIIPGVSFPQGQNAIENLIPVARISDLLLRGGEHFDFNGIRYQYPETKLVYWAGGNPFHHHQDLNLLMKAWQKPDTIIAHEWCWNSLAKRADIVLPCTTTLERQDIAMTPRDPYVVSMSKLIEPNGQARDDYDIFAGISEERGVGDDFTEGRSKLDWQRWIYEQTQDRAQAAKIDMPNYETFLKDGWFKLNDPVKPTVMLESFREDPAANPLDTPSGRIEIFSKTVADFRYDDCPGHPVWQEPYEWLGRVDPRWPLHLISNQPKDKLHSQFDHGQVSRAKKVNSREPIHINPRDAAERHLKNGDVVQVKNARGACLAGVVIDKALREGVVQMSTGAWYDPEDPSKPNSICKHGNPNVLTRDKGTSKLGQGPTAHTCMVNVDLYQKLPPSVTAHEPPEILRIEITKHKEN